MAKAKKKVVKKTAAKKAPPSKAASKARKFKGDEVLLRAPDVLFRTNLNGEMTLIRTNDLEYHYTIDGLAAEMWKRIDGRKKLRDILAQIEQKPKWTVEAMLQAAGPVVTDLMSYKLLKQLA